MYILPAAESDPHVEMGTRQLHDPLSNSLVKGFEFSSPNPPEMYSLLHNSPCSPPSYSHYETEIFRILEGAPNCHHPSPVEAPQLRLKRFTEAAPEQLQAYKEKLFALLQNSDKLDAEGATATKALFSAMREKILAKTAEIVSDSQKGHNPSWGHFWTKKLTDEYNSVVNEIGSQLGENLIGYLIQAYKVGVDLADEGLKFAQEHAPEHAKLPEIDISAFSLDPETIKIQASFSADLVTNMNGVQLAALNKELALSMSFGESPSKLIERLAISIDKGPWKSARIRAEMIVRTETARVQELGRMQRRQQQQKAYPHHKLLDEFLCAPMLEWPCKTCEPYDGKVWAIDGTPHKHTLKRPSVPVHVCCRCTFLPHFDEEIYAQSNIFDAYVSFDSDSPHPDWFCSLTNGKHFPLNIHTPKTSHEEIKSAVIMGAEALGCKVGDIDIEDIPEEPAPITPDQAVAENDQHPGVEPIELDASPSDLDANKSAGRKFFGKPMPNLGTVSLDLSDLNWKGVMDAGHAFLQLPKDQTQHLKFSDPHGAPLSDVVEQLVEHLGHNAGTGKTFKIQNIPEWFLGSEHDSVGSLTEAIKLGHASLSAPSTVQNLKNMFKIFGDKDALIAVCHSMPKKAVYSVMIEDFKKWLDANPPKSDDLLQEFATVSHYDYPTLKAAIMSIFTGQKYQALKKQYFLEAEADHLDKAKATKKAAKDAKKAQKQADEATKAEEIKNAALLNNDHLSKELHEVLNSEIVDPSQPAEAKQAEDEIAADLAHGKAVVFSKPAPSWAPLADKVKIQGQPLIDSGALDWTNIPDKVWEPVPNLTMKHSSGMVLIDDDESVWIVEPKTHYGGYSHTWPKGGVEKNLTPQQNAAKEVYEESGLIGEPLIHLGDYTKTTSITTLYVGKKVAGLPWNFGKETESVKLVSLDKAKGFFDQLPGYGQQPANGKYADMKAVDDLQALIIQAKTKFPNIPLTAAMDKLGQEVKKEKDKEAAEALKIAQEAAKVAAELKTKQDAADAAKAAQVKAAQDAAEKAIADSKAHIADRTLDFSSLTKYADKTDGATSGGFYHDAAGKKYLVKFYSDHDQVKTEKLANDLYTLAGLNAPKSYFVKDGSKTYFASEVVEGLFSKTLNRSTIEGQIAHDPGATSPLLKQIAKGYAADTWLANWDVIGQNFDNLLASKSGKVWRIDTGGTMQHRAMGGTKPFSEVMAEWESMRKGNESRLVFGKMSGAALESGVSDVLKIGDEEIRKQVYNSGFEGHEAEELIKVLIARRENLRKKFVTENPILKNLPKVNLQKGIFGQVKGLVGFQEAARIEAAKAKGKLITEKDWKQENIMSLEWTSKIPNQSEGKVDYETMPKDTSTVNYEAYFYMNKKRKEEIRALVSEKSAKALESTAQGWQGSPWGTEGKKLHEAWHDMTFGNSVRHPELAEAIAASYHAVQETLDPGAKVSLVRGTNWDHNWQELVAGYLWGRRKIAMTVRIVSGWSTSLQAAQSFAGVNSGYSPGMVFRKEFDPKEVVGGWGLTPGWENSEFVHENEFQCIADACDPTNPQGGKIFLDIETEIECNQWGAEHPKYKTMADRIAAMSASERDQIKNDHAHRFGPQGKDFKESIARMRRWLESIGAQLADIDREDFGRLREAAQEAYENLWTQDEQTDMEQSRKLRAARKTAQAELWAADGLVWEIGNDVREDDWLKELRKQKAA